MERNQSAERARKLTTCRAAICGFQTRQACGNLQVTYGMYRSSLLYTSIISIVSILFSLCQKFSKCVKFAVLFNSSHFNCCIKHSCHSNVTVTSARWAESHDHTHREGLAHWIRCTYLCLCVCLYVHQFGLLCQL